MRFRQCRGMPVEDRDGDRIGVVSGILIHPDTGKIEGLTVRASGGFLGGREDIFCGREDIIHFGMCITVRDRESLCSPRDIFRLCPLLEDRRTVIGQPMVTESGVRLGTCSDVQFNTETFLLEWLIPRKLLVRGTPVPLSCVIEIRRDAIIVRTDATVPILNPLPDVA